MELATPHPSPLPLQRGKGATVCQGSVIQWSMGGANNTKAEIAATEDW